MDGNENEGGRGALAQFGVREKAIEQWDKGDTKRGRTRAWGMG